MDKARANRILSQAKLARESKDAGDLKATIDEYNLFITQEKLQYPKLTLNEDTDVIAFSYTIIGDGMMKLSQIILNMGNLLNVKTDQNMYKTKNKQPYNFPNWFLNVGLSGIVVLVISIVYFKYTDFKKEKNDLMAQNDSLKTIINKIYSEKISIVIKNSATAINGQINIFIDSIFFQQQLTIQSQ